MFRKFLEKNKLISITIVTVLVYISILSVQQILFRSKELVIFINKQTMLEVNNIIKNQLSLVQSLSELEYIKNEDIPIQKRALTLKPFQDKYNFILMGLLDKEGNRASSLESEITNLSHREYFKEVKKNKKSAVSNIIYATTNGEKTIVIAHPLLNNKNEFLGAIYSAMHLSHLILLENRYKAAAEDYSTSILDSNLNIILENKHIEIEKDNLLNNSFGFSFKREGYNLHAITFTKDSISNWYIITDLNASKYFINTWANTLIMVLILILIFSVFFLSFNNNRKKELIPILNSLNRDYLTGIYNRKYLEDYMKNIKFIKNESLFFILDIDNFKAINDELGHTTGDYVICETASKISEIFSNDSIVSRVGGDEFIVFIKKYKNRDAILNRIKSLLSVMDTSYSNKNINIKISASIGITFIENDNYNFIDLYSKTDISLYKAKNCGKNCAYISDSNDEIVSNYK
ncbi:MAG: diguanylate cyclase domain-containing protein [Fusobacteriaceae bacterium]